MAEKNIVPVKIRPFNSFNGNKGTGKEKNGNINNNNTKTLTES